MLRCITNNTTSNDNIVWHLGEHWAQYHHTLRNWLNSIIIVLHMGICRVISVSAHFLHYCSAFPMAM